MELPGLGMHYGIRTLLTFTRTPPSGGVSITACQPLYGEKSKVPFVSSKFIVEGIHFL
jgi:hypothetical protein